MAVRGAMPFIRLGCGRLGHPAFRIRDRGMGRVQGGSRVGARPARHALTRVCAVLPRPPLQALVLYNAVTVPLGISYTLPTTGNILNYLEYSIDLIFAVDICVNFRSGRATCRPPGSLNKMVLAAYLQDRIHRRTRPPGPRCRQDRKELPQGKCPRADAPEML